MPCSRNLGFLCKGTGRHPSSKVCWALSEAMKDADREFFGKPGLVVAIHRDERKQKLQIRFTASCDTLEVRRGTLGFTTNPGKAAGINAATKEIFEAFFTPRIGCPRCRRSPKYGS